MRAAISLCSHGTSPLPDPLGQQSGSWDSAAAGISTLLPPKYLGDEWQWPFGDPSGRSSRSTGCRVKSSPEMDPQGRLSEPAFPGGRGAGFRGAVRYGLCSLAGPGPRLARRPGRQPDYISLLPARCREAARREAFVSGESPRWPRGEGGVSARAAAVAALERGEARAAPRERFRAGNRRGSLDCSAVPASAPGCAPVRAPVRPRARGVSVPADAVSAGGSGRGDGWRGTAGPRWDPPACHEQSGAGAPARLARAWFSPSRSEEWFPGRRRKEKVSQGASAGRTGRTARLPRGLSFPRCCSGRGADRFPPGVILGTLEASP